MTASKCTGVFVTVKMRLLAKADVSSEAGGCRKATTLCPCDTCFEFSEADDRVWDGSRLRWMHLAGVSYDIRDRSGVKMRGQRSYGCAQIPWIIEWA